MSQNKKRFSGDLKKYNKSTVYECVVSFQFCCVDYAFVFSVYIGFCVLCCCAAVYKVGSLRCDAVESPQFVVTDGMVWCDVLCCRH